MEIIAQEKLWSFPATGRGKNIECFDIRKDRGRSVKNFLDLATRVAHLQFRNPNYVMLFRGQTKDHTRTNSEGTSFTSLTPSLLRPSMDRNPNSQELRHRFQRLKVAEGLLVEEYEANDLPDVERLKRQKILRWAILQHYEICATPLLDVTHSLRIAASFASLRAQDECFVFVLGVPNLSGAITASAEAGIQTVRLASVCPPNALRPHIQEGYLLGEYPDLDAYNQKEHYAYFETDFGRRLVAKFRFDAKRFWKDDTDFPRITEAALYPNNDDPLYRLATSIKSALKKRF